MTSFDGWCVMKERSDHLITEQIHRMSNRWLDHVGIIRDAKPTFQIHTHGLINDGN